MNPADFLDAGSGAIVGFVLGLIGGGGSILAVPLMIYVVGIASTHVAIGTSAIAVAGSALVNLLPHWRGGRVKWRCAGVFAASGVAGALGGSSLAKLVDGDKLLFLFALLMLVIGALMLRKRKGEGDQGVRLTAGTARHLLPRLIVGGALTGLLSGFFGIGGGFLIVPVLMMVTGMPLVSAIGSSLVSVFAFGASTAANYAISGLVDWRLAAIFVGGAALGGALGAAVGRLPFMQRKVLQPLFALVVMAVGLFTLSRSISAWA